jgi:hypothetical protein
MADSNGPSEQEQPAAQTPNQAPDQTPGASASASSSESTDTPDSAAEPAASGDLETVGGDQEEEIDALSQTDGDGSDKSSSPFGTGAGGPEQAPPDGPGSGSKGFNPFKRRPNIYLMLFILVILVGATVALVAYRQNKKASNDQINTQGISQSTLEQLANSDASVGDSHTVLNVKSSAVFAGQVLVRQNLEVGGNFQVGGTTALKDLTVSGTSQFGQTNVSSNLSVSGNAALQGAATIGKSLQVGGGGTFNGPVSAPQVTTGSLQLNGDLVLTHHIHVGGGQPSRNGGSALGRGGSASVSGSDTAGAVSINTGSGSAAGCFVTINFTSHYTTTPYVQVTPVGSAAGGLDYYINRSTTGFSICDSSAPPSGRSFGFDYFVLD